MCVVVKVASNKPRGRQENNRYIKILLQNHSMVWTTKLLFLTFFPIKNTLKNTEKVFSFLKFDSKSVYKT